MTNISISKTVYPYMSHTKIPYSFGKEIEPSTKTVGQNK
jgi:hypothetical protein